MKFYNKDKVLNIFFLEEEHLRLLTAKSIPFSDLPHLLYYSVALKDLISWVGFQRSKEKELFGRTFTKYDLVPPLHLADKQPLHDMELVTPQLEKCYSEVKYYGSYNFNLIKVCNDTLVILCKDTSSLEDGFELGFNSIHKTLYYALISSLGYHQLYFDESVATTALQGIALPDVIVKL